MVAGPGGSPTKGHGIGMQNIKERLAYFYPDSYTFDAVAPVGGGYEVTIQILMSVQQHEPPNRDCR